MLYQDQLQTIYCSCLAT